MGIVKLTMKSDLSEFNFEMRIANFALCNDQ
jgi:hypothetical protein